MAVNGTIRGDLTEVARTLAGAENVVVIGHLRPDADAIGSVTALVAALRQLGVTTRGIVGQPERFADNLYTIPGADEIALATELPQAQWYVTVDCGSLDRTGALQVGVEKHRDQVIVIDHHNTNPGFGALNYIEDDAESTTTILHELMGLMGVSITPEIAHSLYAGLMTDTGSFRWGTPRMHRLAAELMDDGIDIRQISADLLDEVSAFDLKMVGGVLANIDMLTIDGLEVAVLTADHDTVAGHSSAAVESLVDFVHSIRGAQLGIVFKSSGGPGRWAVSLRSRYLDVSELATRLGGGGHVAAAGYTTEGTAAEVLDEAVAVVRELGPWNLG